MKTPSMNRRPLLLMLMLALSLGGLAQPARAALDIGDRAPDFTLMAALAGQPFTYSLAGALAKGPVVLYFFPLAFSEACSIEAHNFAEATPEFTALGASVVGVSTDDLATLTRFSVQACNGRFPVASDATKQVVAAFDATMQTRPDHANRISYVIAPDGKIIHSYLSLNPTRHVERTLAAVRLWRSTTAPR